MGRIACTVILLLSAALPLGSCAGTHRGKEDWPQAGSVVLSPTGRVRLEVMTERTPVHIAVKSGDATVVEPSPLSFSVDGVELLDNARIESASGYEGNAEYATRGVHARAVDRHAGTKFKMKHASGASFVMDVRAFEDGVAYRFVVEGEPDQSRVPEEKSTFALPADSTTWSHGMRGHYEGDYTRRDVDQIPAGEWVAPPLTAKLPGGAGYVSISEANLVNYSGFALEATGSRRFAIGLGHRQPVSYPYELRYSKEDIARLSKPAKIIGTITTPWRVVIVAQDLNTLVNSDIISHLAEPADRKLFPQGVATDWVKPGRAVWQYLDRDSERDAPADPLATTAAGAATRRAPTTTAATTRARRGTSVEDMKTFSRLAAELGFEYNVLEGFWSRWSDDEIRDLVAYSRDRGVGIFVWVHSNRLFEPANRAALFKRLRDTGVVGLKVDFFDHEHKEVIDLYHALLREGAENKILFDFHGANKPAGEARTYPNELVREAVRGMEASRLKERALHNTTLPFTRYVVGHAEYTPLHFGDRRGDTTWTHQIASAAVFTAPLLTYGAHPRKMLQSPAADVIKSIPATWDETIVLPPSEIGEIAVMARRKGESWFLAAINGPDEKRFEVPFTFLGDGNYRALIVSDGLDGPASLKVDKAQATRDVKLTMELGAGGGFIARFDKE